MKTFRNGRNLLVMRKKAELFDSAEINNSMLFIGAGHRSVAVIKLEELHACLFCPELRNITLIVRGEDTYKVSFIMEKMEEFENLLTDWKAQLTDVEFSEQNKKITGYASAIVEKLQEGTILTIIEKKEDSNIKYCPDCGVQCDPSIPYCMECGATIG